MKNSLLPIFVVICLLLPINTWSETFGIYSNDHQNPDLEFDEDIALYVWEETGKLGELKDNDSLSGEYMRLAYSNTKGWFGIGYAVLPDGNLKDMSRFRQGHLCVSLRSSDQISGKLKIGIKSGNTRAGDSWVNLGGKKKYGFEYDGEWHNLKIPIADFRKAKPNFFNESKISQYFMLSGKKIRSAGAIDFDEIYWELP